MDYIISNGELYHHGIKGMKWGVRRFQTKDGSLTPAGKKRYTTIIEGKVKAEKHANDARREAYKSLNASPKKHSHFQYDVAAEQAARAARKKSIIEQKEANRQARADKKAEKKAFQDDVKEARKKGLAGDYEFDRVTGELKITQFYNSKGEKIGRDYAAKVMKQASRANTISAIAKTAAVIAGVKYVNTLLQGRG